MKATILYVPAVIHEREPEMGDRSTSVLMHLLRCSKSFVINRSYVLPFPSCKLTDIEETLDQLAAGTLPEIPAKRQLVHTYFRNQLELDPEHITVTQEELTSVIDYHTSDPHEVRVAANAIFEYFWFSERMVRLPSRWEEKPEVMPISTEQTDPDVLYKQDDLISNLSHVDLDTCRHKNGLYVVIDAVVRILKYEPSQAKVAVLGSKNRNNFTFFHKQVVMGNNTSAGPPEDCCTLKQVQMVIGDIARHSGEKKKKSKGRRISTKPKDSGKKKPRHESKRVLPIPVTVSSATTAYSRPAEIQVPGDLVTYGMSLLKKSTPDSLQLLERLIALREQEITLATIKEHAKLTQFKEGTREKKRNPNRGKLMVSDSTRKKLWEMKFGSEFEGKCEMCKDATVVPFTAQITRIREEENWEPDNVRLCCRVCARKTLYWHNRRPSQQKERALVWLASNGDHYEEVCFACQEQRLSFFSEWKQGLDHLQNSRPVCQKCKKAMKHLNVTDFMLSRGFDKKIHAAGLPFTRKQTHRFYRYYLPSGNVCIKPERSRRLL